jgi:hypothetical protein
MPDHQGPFPVQRGVVGVADSRCLDFNQNLIRQRAAHLDLLDSKTAMTISDSGLGLHENEKNNDFTPKVTFFVIVSNNLSVPFVMTRATECQSVFPGVGKAALRSESAGCSTTIGQDGSDRSMGYATRTAHCPALRVSLRRHAFVGMTGI